MGTLLSRRRYMGGSAPQPIDYGYFRIVPVNNCTVTLNIHAPVSEISTMSYSVDDGDTWNNYTKVSGTQLRIQISASAGVPILWKGSGTSMAHSAANGNYSIFSATDTIDIEGDFNSLVWGDNYNQDYTYPSYIFAGLFRGNTKLRYAHNSIIHCDTAGVNCFDSTFNGATNMSTPPVMKINTIGTASCNYMFYNAGITYCPQLNMKTIAARCFVNMFYGCVNITEGMDLPALTLADSCYSGMYSGCTSLSRIKMLATNISANRCLNGWVNGVAAEGTFIKNRNATWTTTGANGVPTGWTIEYE